MRNELYWADFWWSRMTGAQNMIRRTACALLDGQTAVLKLPPDLPWPYTMRDSVRNSLNDHSTMREVVVHMVDAGCENPAQLSPGRFLLEHYATEDVAAGYRDLGRVTIQAYLQQHGVLHNCLIWVRGLDEKSARAWLDFCGQYRASGVTEGLFVLEIPDTLEVLPRKTMQCIAFQNAVSKCEVQLFSSLLLSEQEEQSPVWRSYLAALAAELCGTNAELAFRLLRETDLHGVPAAQALQKLDAAGYFAGRGGKTSTGRLLQGCRTGNPAEVEHRVWTAQVQTLFPLIELERQKLVQKWRPQLEQALQVMSFQQYGKAITEPEEVELGTWCMMLGCRLRNDQYAMFLPEDTDRERISFLHECRNRLAHAGSCAPEQVQKLLEPYRDR